MKSYRIFTFRQLVKNEAWRDGVFSEGNMISAMMLSPPTAGTVGMVLAVGPVFPLGIWCVLIGLRYLKLGKIA